MKVMTLLVTLLESTIKKIKTADGKSQVIKSEAFPGDTFSPEYYQNHGLFSRPTKDSKGVFVPIGPSRSFGVIIGSNNYKIEHDIDTGETILYSTNTAGDEVKATVYLKTDGNIELNGNGDKAVRYSKLETAFNQLQSDFDSLVNTYNTHIHVTTATVGATAVVGVLSPTVSQGNTSTADITPAKIDEIEVP